MGTPTDNRPWKGKVNQSGQKENSWGKNQKRVRSVLQDIRNREETSSNTTTWSKSLDLGIRDLGDV